MKLAKFIYNNEVKYIEIDDSLVIINSLLNIVCDDSLGDGNENLTLEGDLFSKAYEFLCEKLEAIAVINFDNIDINEIIAELFMLEEEDIASGVELKVEIKNLD